MNNRYALIQYDDTVADYDIREEFDHITHGDLQTFETPDEAMKCFRTVLENFGYDQVEEPSKYEDWEKKAEQYAQHSLTPSRSDGATKAAIIKLLAVMTLAEIDQARSAIINNEIMARFLDPIKE
jgi:hypothetical protein